MYIKTAKRLNIMYKEYKHCQQVVVPITRFHVPCRINILVRWVTLSNSSDYVIIS